MRGSSAGERERGGGLPVSGSVSLGPELRIDPGADRWPTLTNRAERDELAAETRRAMGLDLSRPVVMSGHQPTLWHTGILAKRFALAAYAEAHNAQAVWLVVDQDDVDPWLLDVPTVSEHGALASEPIRIAPPPQAGMPAALTPAVKPTVAAPGNAAQAIRDRIARMCSSLSDHAGCASSAGQVEAATAALLEGHTTGRAMRTLYASDLHALPVFGRMVDAMRRDPEAAAGAYNAAVVRFGGARPLRDNAGDWELPIWRLDRGRWPVFASQLDGLDRSAMTPRALSMTAMLRLEACDLFIHGTGGGATGSAGGYDRATEAWIAGWQGSDLAPAVVVSADLRLDLPVSGPLLTTLDRQRAVNRAHSALHNPALVGDTRAQAEKDALVRKIAGASGFAARASLYRELHAVLAAHRAAHIGAIETLGQEADAVVEKEAVDAIALRRDWSFALHPDASIEALRRAVDAAMMEVSA